MNARIVGPLSRLPCNVLAEDVIELVAVGTGDDNSALFLVDQVGLDVLEHSGLMEFPDEIKFRLREFHSSHSPYFDVVNRVLLCALF